MELGFQKTEEEEEEEEEYSVWYKLVPWLSWNEWNFVRESLFSSSADSIAAALKRISAWRSRGCLPVAIEVTASIVEVQQKDPFFRKGSSNDASDSEEILSMLYSMAIMRLVNGVIEKTRKKTEVSIAEAANAIGIPRMLIDIRHESSHRDLPSLHMVRLASVKALDWLKSYYWDPQKNFIPFQRDGIANIRKEIKSKLRELAFHLSTKLASQSGSSSKKGKRSKKQVKRILGVLVQLYSSYPLEVVAVMLEFLLKALGSSDGDEEEALDDSRAEPSPNLKIVTSTADAWKLMVTRFATKEPELLLTMLKAILEMIETREARALETGVDQLSSSQYKAEIHQIEYLSSMVPWLIDNLKKGKSPSKKGSGDEIQDSSAELDHIPKVALTELLKKCLLVSSPGNTQLADSALLLAQMLGNDFMVKKLRKLSLLRLPNTVGAQECSTCSGVEKILFEQEHAISQAAEKLEFLKLRRAKGNTINTTATNVNTGEKESTWKLAEFWNPCPIGMLPRVLGSTGVIPVLDRPIKIPEIEQVSESEERWELNRCSGKRESSCDVEFLENSTVSKKKREMVESGETEDLKGYLMIGGVWKKVRQEEIHAIESAVRILV
ncbi:Las1-like [Macleaya cordata]|uniref:Las1-like n=1 Tax=Macleaya cordata TaxID=56857 RepID=A0A200R731_MACCD|nr:Las1-like [Macleaya cordata]